MPKATTKTDGPKVPTNRTQPYPKTSPNSNAPGKENEDPTRKAVVESNTARGDYRDIHLDLVNGEVSCYDDASTVRRKLKKLVSDKYVFSGYHLLTSDYSLGRKICLILYMHCVSMNPEHLPKIGNTNFQIVDRSIIPSTSKKWSQASLAAEMQELEKRGPQVGYNSNAVNGPTPRSLGNFLKATGRMGAGDSPCYYWGYVLLEKLSVYNGEKKSKPRLKAEEG